jgi:hypothetical protein
VVAGGYIYFRAAFPPVEAGALEAALNRARAQGLVTSIADLDALNQPGSNDTAHKWQWIDINITDHLNGLSDGIKRSERQQLEDAYVGKLDIPAAAILVNKLAPVYRALGPITGGVACNPKRDWRNPLTVSFPEIAKFKTASRLFALRAEVRAGSGDTKGALEDLAVCANLYRQAASGTTLLAGITKIAIRSTALKAAARMAMRAPNDAELLAALLEALSAFPIEELKQELGFELAATRQYLDLIRVGRIRGGTMLGGGFFKDRIASFAAAEAELIVVRRAAEIAEQWPGRKAVSEAVSRFAREDRMNMSRPAYRLASEAWVGVTTVKNSEGRHFALDRVTRIGIACLILKAETGAWPSLEDAAARARCDLSDPFSGLPLQMRTRDAAVIVYSVGVNGIDDAGRTNTGRRQDDADRFLFIG